MGKPPRIFTLLGCTVEVAPGGQSAKASRVELRDKGVLLRSAASAEFKVIHELDAPSPEVQAIRWVHSLPQIIDAVVKPIEELEYVYPAPEEAAEPIEDVDGE